MEPQAAKPDKIRESINTIAHSSMLVVQCSLGGEFSLVSADYLRQRRLAAQAYLRCGTNDEAAKDNYMHIITKCNQVLSEMMGIF